LNAGQALYAASVVKGCVSDHFFVFCNSLVRVRRETGKK